MFICLEVYLYTDFVHNIMQMFSIMHILTEAITTCFVVGSEATHLIYDIIHNEYETLKINTPRTTPGNPVYTEYEQLYLQVYLHYR